MSDARMHTEPPRAHLAQLNIGRLLAPAEDPRVADFMNNLDRVNRIADRSPGFVWRMVGEGNDATDIKLDGDLKLIANLSVWEDVDSLAHFVWSTVHKRFYDRKAEWFETIAAQHFVMWRVPVGHRPSLEEGRARLAHLNAHGDGDHAFGWSHSTAADAWRRHRCAA